MDDIKNAAFTADTVEEPPVVRKTTPLEYPAFARKKGISGYVYLVYNLTSGKVEKEQVIESSPPVLIRSQTAVKNWEFDPVVIRVKLWLFGSSKNCFFKLNSL